MNLKREDSDLERQVEEAWQLFVAGRWDEALRLVQSILLLEPDSPMANSVAGACLLRLGHIEEAEAYTRTGVRLAPGIALAHTFLAETLWANEKYEEAESEFWEAVALNPAAPDSHIALGRFILSRDRHGEARPIIEKAITLSEEDADAHYLMAVCAVRDEATEEALNEIDLAIKFAPESDRVWHFRGLVLMSRARGLRKQQERVALFRDVSESLRKAVELNPGNSEARENLKAVYAAIAAIDQYLDSIAELKRNWWQIVLFVAGLVAFAVFEKNFWINALMMVAAASALALWRNRRRIAGLAPDPFESIHPLKLGAAAADLRSTNNAPVVNEWLN